MMRKWAVVGFAFLFFSVAVSAQTDSKGNISFGYSFARTNLSPTGALGPSISSSNLGGWYTSFEYKPLPWLGAEADFGGRYGTEHVAPFCEVIPVCPSPLNANANVHTFLFGPRVSVPLGKVTPFAHALFGGAHTSANGTGFSLSDTSFATALGGGADFRLTKTLGWRVQGDFLQTRFFNTSQNDFRFSTGLVVRF
jgi:opacity protein-like surface antigen